MMGRVALILSNSDDATSDYLCLRLREQCIPHLRFDTDVEMSSVELHLDRRRSLLRWDDDYISPEDIAVLILRRPKPVAPDVEGDLVQKSHASDEWAEALEGFLAQVPRHRWMNHPSNNFNASHKVDQLIRATEMQLSVPDWVVTNSAKEAGEFLCSHNEDIIAKPLARGYLERKSPKQDTVIYTVKIDRSHSTLFDRLPSCPVLFQERLDKESDVRLIAVDCNLVAACMFAREANGEQRLDIRRNNMEGVTYYPLAIPDGITVSIRRLLSYYGLRFAAIDFAVTKSGQWVFLEINPNGQWAWLDLDGSIDVGRLFVSAILASGVERI